MSKRKPTLPKDKNQSPRWIVSDVVILGILAVWGLVKWKLFDGLSYTSDLFGQMQSARSWMFGHPLFYNSDFLLESHTHNYWMLIPLGPIVDSFGALGVFVVHLAILFGSTRACSRAIALKQQKGIVFSSVLSIALLLGPFAFWIFDDPLYGWHSELLFLPLIVWLGASHALHSKLEMWVAGVLIVLLREEGAILVGIVHCISRILVGLRSEERVKSWGLSVLGLTALYSGIFLFSMYLLAGNSGPGQGRLQDALDQLLSLQGGEAVGVQRSLMYCGAIVGFTALVAWIGGFRFSVVVLALIGTLPIWIINLVASAVYLPDLPSFLAHGMTWPARMAPLLGTFFALLLVAEPARSFPDDRSPSFAGAFLPMCRVFLAFSLSLVVGSVILVQARDYSPLERIRFGLPGHDGGAASLLSSREQSVLRCLGRNLPHDVGVVVGGLLFRYFQFQFHCGFDKFDRTLPELALIVCDSARRFPFQGECAPAQEWATARGWEEVAVSPELKLHLGPSWKQEVSECLKEAGGE